MRSIDGPVNIAVLDDYQAVARELADWAKVEGRAPVRFSTTRLADPERVVERLLPFDVVCVMRERTPLPRALLERLPRLKLIASTGPVNAAIDVAAATELGIAVTHTGYESTPPIELTWVLILASARHIVGEAASLRAGGWQRAVGDGLRGKTLGVLGLGRIGSEVARIGRAFGMELIAWSHNLTAEKAEAHGARLVSKDELFRQAGIVTIHLILSRRTRGLVGAAELPAMKSTARLVVTARAPNAPEAALGA